MIFVVYNIICTADSSRHGRCKRWRKNERRERCFETTMRRTGNRDRARGAPSSPHLNKTAVSCVYRVQRERERTGTDKRLQIVPVTNRRALLLAYF